MLWSSSLSPIRSLNRSSRGARVRIASDALKEHGKASKGYGKTCNILKCRQITKFKRVMIYF